MSIEHPYYAETYSYMEAFRCVEDKCIDTCCRGWDMQLSADQFNTYQQQTPELLGSVCKSQRHYVMKRSSVDDICVEHVDGLCKIQQHYDASLLADACHIYPRVVRQVHERYVMTASLSCPEIARLILYGMEDPFSHITLPVDRLPFTIDDYGISSVSYKAMDFVIKRCLSVIDAEPDFYHICMRLLIVAKRLEALPSYQWHERFDGLWRQSVLQIPRIYEEAGSFYVLLAALVALMRSAQKRLSSRLYEVVAVCQQALHVGIDYDTGVLTNLASNAGDYSQAAEVIYKWQQEMEPRYNDILKRWLKAQLAMSYFPYAGFGGSPFYVMLIITIRFATLRLGLASFYYQKQSTLTEKEVIDVVQPLARFMDHLADPTLSLTLYHDAGWDNLSRLGGMV